MIPETDYTSIVLTAVAIIAAVLIVSGIIAHLIATYVAGYCVYTSVLKRKSKDQWNGEGVSEPVPELLSMAEHGKCWHNQHCEAKKDVHIVRDGFNLYGEYYDLGFDRAVIILSGRTEGHTYGYFFAKPYSENGFNVLVLDPRAHGKSDGTYNTVGFEEGKDAAEWAKYLHDEHGVKAVMLHGICIGAAAGMYAITDKAYSDYICGLVTEGMFPCFAKSMRNQLIERKRMFFPILQAINFWMKRYTGYSMFKGPKDFIVNLNKPLLMLNSKEDIYSLPEDAKMMFDLCPSKQKRFVLFEKGGHSKIRINNMEKYDSAIAEFIKSYF